MLQGPELGAVFAHLTGEAAREPLDTQSLLSTLVAGAVRLFGARGAAVRYQAGPGGVVWTAGTDDALRDLIADAADWREGPAHDSSTTGGALIDVDVTTLPVRAHWPRWSARVQALGYGRVTALPLPAKEGAAGAIALFDAPGRRLDEPALALARSYTDAAAHTLSLQREVTESRVLAGQLEYALSSRVVVEQAKGILAARHDLTLEEAFSWLRGYARSHQRKVADVAREIIEGKLEFPAG
ncbi:GAF and ANTAR domain-containing protein [Streptomyces sp. VRA16 Mangrove soil]|uniref:GAF and ANTAR domain-containing protein n=1 Tax=Streptomyces sp. VRA16 Mangrove soil TaxID=2817434 RepID=UPI001A9DAE9F|nr:GAF and ANTAR domain-containing protein [Streptomyces sp. VRA16 Mangrove soil]MBO1333286.1 GAF and ANTAR domain-containing protein [Streptomyces sp. VRA16 Mangrove soil]